MAERYHQHTVPGSYPRVLESQSRKRSYPAMAKHDELIIEPRDDGRWGIKKPHAERSSDVKDTQKLAIRRAKRLAPEGDIKLKGLNGKFRKVQSAK
jgi:hypothetical protein